MANKMTSAAQNATTNTSTKGCQFCGKEGLMILPLRYGTLATEGKAPALPKTLGKLVSDVSLVKSSYAVRMSRQGFYYLLVNRKESLTWQCYASTSEGYLAEFPAATPPFSVPAFTCQPNTCGLNASLIAIKEAEEVATAYLMFTPDPLTEVRLNALKSTKAAEAACAQGLMVKFSPAACMKAKFDGPDCLNPESLSTVVPEFLLGKKSSGVFDNPLAKALMNSAFPLMHAGGEDRSSAANIAVAATHLSRLDSLTRYMLARKSVAVATYDPIGVTQELNDFRNDGYNTVQDFLLKPDAEKVTNQWRFDSLQAIREIKTGFENGMVSDIAKSDVETELHIRARHEPPFPEDSDDQMRHKVFPGRYPSTYQKGREAWRREFPQKAAALDAELNKFQAEQPDRVAQAKKNASKRWQEKYGVLLDSDSIKSFDDAFESAGKDALKVAEARVDDHLKWVLHQRFVDAFDVYDRHNDKSGFQFEAQAALCTQGMVGVEKSAAQIDAWLAAPVGQKQNIYMRGLLLNQEAIEKEAKTALDEAAKIAAAAPTVAAISGDKMYKALKGLIDLYRKADSAWDEFVRNSGEAPGFQNTYEGSKLFKWSETNRAIFRAGITKLEMNMVGRFAGLTFARLGQLAHELTFQELVYGIDPQSPHPDTPVNPTKPARNSNNKTTTTTNVPARDNVSPARASQTGKQVAQQIDPALRALMTDAEAQHQARLQGVTYTADEYLKNNRTNNYHHARIGVLLGVMETIALGAKVFEMRNGNINKIQVLEASANLFSIISIGYDIAYATAKSVREQTKDTAIKGAGDIVRGGFKMWAGAFGAMAGGFGVWADLLKLEEEKSGANRNGQKVILRTRIIVGSLNTFLGATAAYSYSGPMLRRLEINLSESAAKRRAIAGAAAKGAEWLGKRVLLLRLVAWGTGAGWVVLGAEIGYNVYLYYQPSELEIWCKRSAFRNRKEGGNPYITADAEISELAKARKRVGI